MRKSTYLFILSLVVLSGCSFQKDPEKKTVPAPTAADVAEEIEKKREQNLSGDEYQARDVAFEVLEGPKANDYFIKINFPIKKSARLQIQINGATVDDLAPGLKVPVTGGSNLGIKILGYNGLNVLTLNTMKEIVVPTDWSISDTVVLKEDYSGKFGRVYFKDESVLKTNGFLLNIEANTIYASPQSKIINFDLTDVYTNEKQRAGGTITVVAKKAHGLLNINLQGARGPDGENGGKNRPHPNDNTYLYANELVGEDGSAGESEMIYECIDIIATGTKQCGYLKKGCTKAPSDGQPGKRGLPGEDGAQGHVGGDSGNLLVLIENNDDFALRLSLAAGLGGRGGRGEAQGWPGGWGGSAGAPDENGLCPASKPGADGPFGPPGKDGPSGPKGRIGTYEVRGLNNVFVKENP